MATDVAAATGAPAESESGEWVARVADAEARIDAERTAWAFTATESPGDVDDAYRLAAHPDVVVRREVCWDPFAPPEVLAVLADDVQREVRMEVARNPSTPPEVLATLTDPGYEVRLFVARNPSTPPEALTLLADDGDEAVRRGVAVNPNTPLEVLTVLASDNDGRVRKAAGVARARRRG